MEYPLHVLPNGQSSLCEHFNVKNHYFPLLAEVTFLFGVRDLRLASKLTLIQAPFTTLDGTLQTACPVICLQTVT